MKKIGLGALRILQGLAMIYFFASLTIAAPYYNWQYAKDNSFIKWALGGEIVATGKAFIWPYFVFADHMNQPDPSQQILDEVTDRSINSFFAATSSIGGAESLLKNILVSEDFLSDWEDIKLLLRNSQTRLAEVDITVLNSIYDGWGDIVDNALIPAVDFYVAGIDNDFEEVYFARADAMIVRYSNWIQENAQALLLELHDSFGFEIR